MWSNFEALEDRNPITGAFCTLWTSTDEGLVGDENDATSIIEDTGAETEVYLMLTAFIEREEAKLQIKKLPPPVLLDPRFHFAKRSMLR